MNSDIKFAGADDSGLGYLQQQLRVSLLNKHPDGLSIDHILRDEQSVWRILFDNSRDGIVVLDTDGQVVDSNRSFARMLGYRLDELYGLRVWDWDASLEPDRIREILQSMDASGDILETRHRRHDGSLVDVEISNNCISYAGKKLILSICRDITERKENERRIRYMVATDALTGLLNRREFGQRLDQEVSRAGRYPQSMSLVMFDIDHFKRINDRYGHTVGDQVLIGISLLAKGMIRNSDSLARWGGEEFMLMLPATGADQAVSVAEKLRQAIEQMDIREAGKVTVSFGVAGLIDGDTAASVIRRADRAMYAAKEAGRNTVRLLLSDDE